MNKVLPFIAVLLALAPIANITWIVATTGANNPSNDYVFSIGLVDQVLAGTYDWRNFFRDTFIQGSHAMALPILIRLAVAKLTHWNIYVELYVFIALSIVRLLLLHDAFTHGVRHPLRHWLLPLLAALVFSVSQIDVFTYGDAGLQIGLIQLGTVLGIWGLVRFRGSWRAVALMAAGGTMAALSGGGGLMAWPVFVLGMACTGFRQARFYLALFAAGCAAFLPYLIFGILQRKQGAVGINSLFDPVQILNALGWPLSSGIGATVEVQEIGVMIGRLGIGLFCAGLLLLWSLRRTPAPAQALPALLLAVSGLLNTWQLTVFRRGITPWYTTSCMNFWIALIALACVVWMHRQAPTRAKAGGGRLPELLAPIWSAAVLITIVGLYSFSNLAYEDKVMFFLPSRAPAAAAALRQYHTAPTYSEEILFRGFPLGHPDYVERLGRPLERHRLAVFAPEQEWTLQGDFGMDTVQVQETPGVPDVVWSEDASGTPLPWSDYKHLNLLLPSPNSISWTVQLPDNLARAEFRSACALSEPAAADAARNGATFQVFLAVGTDPEQSVFSRHVSSGEREWRPFQIPLGAHAGKRITLRLTSTPGSGGGGERAMYHYPRIHLRLAEAGRVVADQPVVPSNTDLSPGAPRPGPGDVRLDLTKPELWKASDPEAGTPMGAPPGARLLHPAQFLQYRQPLNLRLSDFSHFYMRAAAGPEVTLRALRAFFMYRSARDEVSMQWASLTLLPDSRTHTYTYPLKLLELEQEARLEYVRFLSVSEGGAVRLDECGLIRTRASAE